MSLILNGSWESSYGSVMVLDVAENGFISGEYVSHTGSSGTYLVIGHCQPSNPGNDAGQPLVLSIYWRSVGGEEPDDGSHWVSTYCGQLDNNGQLTVINSLITTTHYQAFSPGDYIDKLVFTKQPITRDVMTRSVELIEQKKEVVANPINGMWVNKEQTIELTVFVQSQKYGVVNGLLSYEGEQIGLLGFTDTFADKNILQSVSLSGYMSKTHHPISLVGRINQDASVLVLSRWLANSTTIAESYLQASSLNWELTKIHC